MHQDDNNEELVRRNRILICKKCCKQKRPGPRAGSFSNKLTTDSSTSSGKHHERKRRICPLILVDIYTDTIAETDSQVSQSLQQEDQKPKEVHVYVEAKEKTDTQVSRHQGEKTKPKEVGVYITKTKAETNLKVSHQQEDQETKSRDKEPKEADVYTKTKIETDSLLACCNCCPTGQQEDQKTKKRNETRHAKFQTSECRNSISFLQENERSIRTSYSLFSFLDNFNEKNGVDFEEKSDCKCDDIASILTIY